MPSSSENLRPGCASRSIHSEFRRGAVAALLIAVIAGGIAGCSNDDPDAPVDPPGGSTATTVDPEAAAGADGAPGTGLISIDGPATVDSSFGAATPDQSGG